MKNLNKWLLGLAIVPVSFFVGANHASASQAVSQWYFGLWNCNIDGRPAQMQWYVVDDPQTTCSDGVSVAVLLVYVLLGVSVITGATG